MARHHAGLASEAATWAASRGENVAEAHADAARAWACVAEIEAELVGTAAYQQAMAPLETDPQRALREHRQHSADRLDQLWRVFGVEERGPTHTWATLVDEVDALVAERRALRDVSKPAGDQR